MSQGLIGIKNFMTDPVEKISQSKVASQSRTGLVLEGGGMRGIYTAGVLDVLGEHGITFDGAVGVSAGAIHAASFLAGQHGRSIRCYLTFSPDPRFMGLRSWLKTGDFVSYPFAYDAIPNRILPLDYDRLEHNPCAFFVTCTDIDNGQPYYYRVKSLRDDEMFALRASASLPLVSRIVEFDGHRLLDGGTADSIPVCFLREQGYPRCVVILTQVAGYRKNPEINRIFRLFYRKYPNYVRAIETRHERYNATLDVIQTLEQNGEIFVFRPSRKIRIKRLERDVTRILDMYELGRRDALARIEELKIFMRK